MQQVQGMQPAPGAAAGPALGAASSSSSSSGGSMAGRGGGRSKPGGGWGASWGMGGGPHTHLLSGCGVRLWGPPRPGLLGVALLLWGCQKGLHSYDR